MWSCYEETISDEGISFISNRVVLNSVNEDYKTDRRKKIDSKLRRSSNIKVSEKPV